MPADRASRGASHEEIGRRSASTHRSRHAPHDVKRPRDALASRRIRQVAPCVLGKRPQLTLGLLQGQLLDPGAKRYLLREGQISQSQEIIVLDKDALQPRAPARREPRRDIDRGTVLRDRVKRDDDALDPYDHGVDPAAARASAAAFAAKPSSRSTIFWFVDAVGTPVNNSKP
jgi:hypothetical protein